MPEDEVKIEHDDANMTDRLESESMKNYQY